MNTSPKEEPIVCEILKRLKKAGFVKIEHIKDNVYKAASNRRDLRDMCSVYRVEVIEQCEDDLLSQKKRDMQDYLSGCVKPSVVVALPKTELRTEATFGYNDERIPQ